MQYVLQEALATLWVSAPILAVFAVGEWLHRARGVSAEHTRKLAHVGAGLAALAMPWVVDTHWTVLGLAAVFVVFLGATRRFGWLPSVHAVARRTKGAHYYPIAVWVSFLLADGDATLYAVAMLVMALSDTGAALVGRASPIVRYHVIDEDYRSLGGSLALFGVTFAVVLAGVSFRGGATLPTVLTVSLLAALVATAVEGVSVRGLDNLLLPYAVLVVLRRALPLPPAAQGDLVLGAGIVFALLLFTRRRARLDVSGFLAFFLAGFAAWALGGPLWFATLVVPWAGFVVSRALVGTRYAVDLRLSISAFVVTLGVLLAHGHSGEALLYVPFVASVAAVTALAWGAFARHRGAGLAAELAAAAAGAALVLVPSLVGPTPTRFGPAEAAFVVACATAAPLVARLSRVSAEAPALRRAVGVLGSTAASFAWLVF